jgi:hypothetical protein
MFLSEDSECSTAPASAENAVSADNLQGIMALRSQGCPAALRGGGKPSATPFSPHRRRIAMKPRARIGLCVPALLMAAATAADAHPGRPLNVAFNNCTEFAGVAPVDEARARALVPARYTLVTDANVAKLVVRVSDCAGVKVGNGHARPGRIAHIGIMIQSPDGTAVDPNTSLNNYTVSYASNLPDLVDGLRAYGVPAAFDAALAYEFAPATGPGKLYAAAAPGLGNSPTWFLYGTVTNPTIPSTFLANWWFLSHSLEIKMATTFPTIYFDFTSAVAFYTSRGNAIGKLLGGNAVDNFPVSFRGQFDAAQMAVTVSH